MSQSATLLNQLAVDIELRNGSSFIGGATDRRKILFDGFVKQSLSLNGGGFS